MPKTKVKNLYIPQGARYIYDVEYLQEDKITPAELEGLSARCHFRSTVEAASVLFDASSYITLNTTTGHIIMVLPANITETFTFADAVYDLEVYDAGNTAIVYRVSQGQVFVDPNITR